MNEAEIRKITSDSLFAGEVDRLLEGARPSVRMHTTRSALEDIALGASRLGGLPDLPTGVAWPERNGSPLDFIAQIDLRDLAGLLPEFPQSGWLLFFFDADDLNVGFDPASKDGWSVFWLECEKELLGRAELPPRLPPKRNWLGRLLFGPGKPRPAYDACCLRFEEKFRLRDEDDEIDRVDITGDDRELAFERLMEATAQWEDGVCHRLGGYPDTIQGPMRLDCQLAANGLNIEYPENYKDPRVKELEPGKSDWELLLQIDSDKNPGWMWGDGGRIYVWIRRQDLAARDFAKAWCMTQCF